MPDVTFTPDPDLSDDEGEGELVELSEVYLADGQCWVLDPDAIHPDGEVTIAMQFRDGGLYVMGDETRRWVSAEAPEPGKPARKFKTVN